MELILASQSPRRQEILGYFSLPFRTVHHRFDEDALEYNGDPESYVRQLAEGKARSLMTEHPDEVILAADSIVTQAGKVYGKPRNADHAFSILMELSGQWHSVLTGVAVAKAGTLNVEVEETRVLFNALTEAQARHYHEVLHCSDKAAGYAVQEAGALIVKRIEGCFYNVMGLPMNTTERLLAAAGLSLWDYLAETPDSPASHAC